MGQLLSKGGTNLVSCALFRGRVIVGTVVLDKRNGIIAVTVTAGSAFFHGIHDIRDNGGFDSLGRGRGVRFDILLNNELQFSNSLL